MTSKVDSGSNSFKVKNLSPRSIYIEIVSELTMMDGSISRIH